MTISASAAAPVRPSARTQATPSRPANRRGRRQRPYAACSWPSSRLGAQNRFRNRIRQRLGLLEDAEQRQDDQEKGEVVEREDARQDHVDALRRLGTEPAERDTGDHEQPEERAKQRPVAPGPYSRGVEPGQEGQDADRTKQRANTDQLVWDRAQDRV